MQLDVIPQLETVPLGAPVRVNFSLANTTDVSLPVPIDLSMKRGHVGGTVIDPAGVVRTFSSMLKCVDDSKLSTLGPGNTMSHSATLLADPKGRFSRILDFLELLSKYCGRSMAFTLKFVAKTL